MVHWLHTLFVEEVHAWDSYCPAPQVAQVLQTVSLLVVQEAVEYVPGPQTEHNWHTVSYKRVQGLS